MYICVYVLYRKHWRWLEVNMRHCQDGSKWMWRKPKDCFRGNLTALGTADWDWICKWRPSHSFWSRRDKRKWISTCQTTQGCEMELKEEEKTEIGKGLPASCSTFLSHFHFYLWIFLFWVLPACFPPVFIFLHCFVHMVIHRPTRTRQPSA